MSKSLFVIIPLAIIIALGVFLTRFTISFCDQALHYKIGLVDERFKITEDQFKKDIEDSAQIWSDSYGKSLFQYDPKGELTVNLIYDERQTLDTEIHDLQDQLDSQKNTLTPEIAAHEKRVADFEKRVAELEKQIEDWNQKGGAPPEEYDKLVKQQAELQQEADSLNAAAANLNQSSKNYNAKVSELNSTVDQFNTAVKEKPEQGLFKGPENAIDIYFSSSRDERLHTITHELGHALGLGHTGDKSAMMYPYSSKVLTLSDIDKKMLSDQCRQRSVAEIISYYVQNLKLSMGHAFAM